MSWYDTKQSDDGTPVMQELRGMSSTPSLPLLPGPLWPGLEAPDRVLSMGQIEKNYVYKQMTDLKLWLLDSNTWNQFCVQKRAQAHLRILSTKSVHKSYIYLIYEYIWTGFCIK